MKIGIYIKSINIYKTKNIDLRKGNPGIGGTEYLFLLLAVLLSDTKVHDIYIYSQNRVDSILNTLHNIYSESVIDALYLAKNDGIDLFVLPPSEDDRIYNLIDKIDLKCITWMQNRFTYDIANHIANTDNIIINVCASQEQYDCIVDHKVWYKSVIIKNCVYENDVGLNKRISEPIVTYMGHLSYNRGFHVLAKQWKKILKKIPNAKLYVIGSADLYDTDSNLGDLGIANPQYEALIKKYITNSNGELLNSITFCGRIGLEKYSIFNNTRVGVVNPISREMGPLSALEMESCSVPVVSIRRYGQLETIKHQYSGLLVHNNKNLWKAILKILLDDQLHTRLSQNAKLYVSNNYSPDLAIKLWEDLFNEINNSYAFKPLMPQSHYFNDYKWIRIINRKIIDKIKFVELPSILYYEKLGKLYLAIFKRYIVRIMKLIKRSN